MTEPLEQVRSGRRPIPPEIKPPRPRERGFTVAAFAKRCGVSEMTVRRWIRDGMPTWQPGGRRGRHVIFESQVDQWARMFRCIGAAPGGTVVADLDKHLAADSETDRSAAGDEAAV